MLLVEEAGTWLALDNRNSATLPIDRLKDYLPILALQADSAWTFGRRRV